MIRLHLWLGTVATTFLLTSLAVTQCAPARKSAQRTFSTSSGPLWPWAASAWTRSDVNFLRARREADAFVRGTTSRSNAKALVLNKLRQLASDAKRDPKSPQAQFRWAYVTHEARKLDVRPATNNKDLFEVYDALDKARPAGSYQYDRMMFITLGRFTYNVKVKPLGLRLLKRDSKDTDVKFLLARVLAIGGEEDQALSLAYAQDVQRRHSELPSAHSLLGWVYSNRWHRHHNLADVDQSIAHYRKYLSLIPATFSTRRDIEGVLASLESEKAQRSR